MSANTMHRSEAELRATLTALAERWERIADHATTRHAAGCDRLLAAIHDTRPGTDRQALAACQAIWDRSTDNTEQGEQ